MLSFIHVYQTGNNCRHFLVYFFMKCAVSNSNIVYECRTYWMMTQTWSPLYTYFWLSVNGQQFLINRFLSNIFSTDHPHYIWDFIQLFKWLQIPDQKCSSPQSSKTQIFLKRVKDCLIFDRGSLGLKCIL